MLNSLFIILSLLVGFVFKCMILTHVAPIDPACYEFKTNKRASDCCKIPVEYDDGIIDSCIAEVEPTQDEEEQLHCVSECIAQELGVLKNRNLDKEATKLWLVNSVGKDPNFAPIIEGVYDKCYDRLAALPVHKHHKCSFAPDFLMNCIDADLFKICPSAVWDVSDGCVELKDKLAKGCPFSAIDKKR